MGKKRILKLNWNNRKLVNVINIMHYSEARLSKDELIHQGTKTLFYQLKKGGYIMQVENSKDFFKATDKLKRQYKQQVNPEATWGGSGSSVHGQGMVEAIKLLPSRIIEEHSIKTEETLKEEFKSFRKTETFKERLENKREYYTELKDDAIQQLSEKRLTVGQYELQMEKIGFLQDILNDRKGISVPDMEVTLNKEEISFMRERCEEKMKGLKGWREQEYYNSTIQTLKKLELTTQREVVISIEVITSSYSDKDIQAKINYADICDKALIFIPTSQ